MERAITSHPLLEAPTEVGIVRVSARVRAFAASGGEQKRAEIDRLLPSHTRVRAKVEKSLPLRDFFRGSALDYRDPQGHRLSQLPRITHSSTSSESGHDATAHGHSHSPARCSDA